MTTFDEYQIKARHTAKYIESIAVFMAPIYKVVHESGDQTAIDALNTLRFYLTAAYVVSGMTGEAGEIANKFKKVIRGDGTLDGMAAELGDVQWYLAEMASVLGLMLDDVAQSNLDKLQGRVDRGVLHGSGDNR